MHDDGMGNCRLCAAIAACRKNARRFVRLQILAAGETSPRKIFCNSVAAKRFLIGCLVLLDRWSSLYAAVHLLLLRRRGVLFTLFVAATRALYLVQKVIFLASA